MSKRGQKSKSASASQKAEGMLRDRTFKNGFGHEKRARGLIRECTKVIRGVRSVKDDMFSVLFLLWGA